MAKITVEYLRELGRDLYFGKITYKNLVELLNEKASEPEWVSVSDRLPETNSEVLCVKKNGLKLILSYHAGFDTLERKFYWWAFDKWMDQNAQVTHWMPLPNKPV